MFKYKHKRFQGIYAVKVLTTILLFLTPIVARAEDVPVTEENNIEKPFEYVVESQGTIHVENSCTLEVVNLVGTVTVESSQEAGMQWKAVVHAIAKDEKRAKELADKLKIKIDEEDPKKITVSASYPVSDHSLYYYPTTENKTKESRKKRGAFKYKTKLIYQDKEVTVMTEPSLAAIYLFADITLKVPSGTNVKIKNDVGKSEIHDLFGELNIESVTALIHLVKGKGKFSFSTATGTVDIQGYDGVIKGASGEANISCSSCTGNIELTSGSGQIVMDDSHFDAIQAKSGSGSISLQKSTGTLLLTTGSGRIQATDFIAKKLVHIETGSGDVRLKGDFSLVETFFIQTGSGSINFVSTPFPKLFFDVRSASGEVKVKVPTMQSKPNGNNVFMGSIDQAIEKVGEKAAIIRSGSGDIRLGTVRKKKSKEK